MQIPEELFRVMQALRAIGRPRLVGGCVRDWLMGLDPKDFDVEVAQVTFEQMLAVLAPFGSTDIVGRSFGVIKLRLNGVEYDFSLPRRESKTGAGHRGFAVAPEPNLSDADAAARRDFTLNAIAYDPFLALEKNDARAGIIDPHNGERDLHARILRHTSDAFSEDPLRVLRGFQLAARFDLTLAPETVNLCRSISAAYHELPVERIWGEWQKWAEKSTVPSRGLALLEQAGWLAHFPELAALHGTPQDPKWHPEGDVFTHTAHCCDALVRSDAWLTSSPQRRRVLLFAVLAHDFGKPLTTTYAERHGHMRWISPGHESAGGPLADNFLKRIGAPREILETVRPLVVNHMVHHSGQADFSPTSLRRLARRLEPSTIDDLCIVMRADNDGRPPLHSPENIERIHLLLSRARSLALEHTSPRPILQGRHLIAHGLKPDTRFKPILNAAFEAQLEGEFSDESGAIKWMQTHVKNTK